MNNHTTNHPADSADDRIDNYVRGLMSDSERRSFESEMERDPELAAEVHRTQQIADRIAFMARKRADIALWEVERRAAEALRRRRRVYGISAAAMIAVVAGIGITMLMHRSADMTAPAINAPVFRGAVADVDDIALMIEAKDYAEALTAIDSALADSVIPDSLPQEQIDYMMQLQVQRAYELKWLKIKVLLALGRTDEAVALLRTYSAMEGDHALQADSLLRQYVH